MKDEQCGDYYKKIEEMFWDVHAKRVIPHYDSKYDPNNKCIVTATILDFFSILDEAFRKNVNLQLESFVTDFYKNCYIGYKIKDQDTFFVFSGWSAPDLHLWENLVRQGFDVKELFRIGMYLYV